MTTDRDRDAARSEADLPSEASASYAHGQLARALRAAETHDDPELRARAVARAEAWTKVFAGMLSGALQVGSRAPIAETPAWATPEVVTGGFVTGELVAGGPLRPHEEALAATLTPRPAPGTERAALNAHFVSEGGLAELRSVLTSGRFRIGVPEEGALLAVAWLLGENRATEARAILDAIGPFFGRLRFYPMPAERAAPDDAAGSVLVHREDLDDARARLAERVVRAPLARMREALEVWAPLTDRFVALFAETVEGEPPTLATDADERPIRDSEGRWSIAGGWPCQRYADDWAERARALLDEERRLRAEYPLCGKPARGHENLARLRGHLETAAADPSRLTGRDVGIVRVVLASIAWKRGLPGAADGRCAALRAAQAAQSARPAIGDHAPLLLARLAALPGALGLEPSDADAAVRPIEADEAADHPRLIAGEPIPARLVADVDRARIGSLDELVARGVVPSADVLATLVPRVAAAATAAAIDDPVQRRLFGAVYVAFRARRSLLLLDLASQVRLEELPWAAALAPPASSARVGPSGECTPRSAETARVALREVTALCFRAFPWAILPNTLLQEMRPLAKAARLERLPLLDELAADIFMGTFSGKFLAAAKEAARTLEGSLYARYYDLEPAAVLAIDDVTATGPNATRASSAFAKLCAERAGPRDGERRFSVAANGKVIEAAQILTTHNLASPFEALGIAETLGDELDELPRRTLTWIVDRLAAPPNHWRARLKMVKNVAYAWRQMVFFLSVATGEPQAFLRFAEEHLGDERRTSVRERLQPAILGLSQAIEGGTVTAPARRLLGWTTEKHWLVAEQPG